MQQTHKPHMTTHATFTADTYDRACELATTAFKEFFGEHPRRFTSEAAEAGVCLMDGTVIAWDVTFEAETTYH